MTVRRKHRPDLGIVELAVDPADVDRDTCPVRIRLTRPLTSYEVASLAETEPGLVCEGDVLVLAAACLDDVARDISLWHARLERAQSRADELEGEVLVADHRRVEAQNRHGSHLLSQQTDDRGLH